MTPAQGGVRFRSFKGKFGMIKWTPKIGQGFKLRKSDEHEGPDDERNQDSEGPHCEVQSQSPLEAVLETKTLTQISQEHGVHPIQVSHWKNALLEKASEGFRGSAGIPTRMPKTGSPPASKRCAPRKPPANRSTRCCKGSNATRPNCCGVLERPHLPIHNNRSETDLRDFRVSRAKDHGPRTHGRYP